MNDDVESRLQTLESGYQWLLRVVGRILDRLGVGEPKPSAVAPPPPVKWFDDPAYVSELERVQRAFERMGTEGTGILQASDGREIVVKRKGRATLIG